MPLTAALVAILFALLIGAVLAWLLARAGAARALEAARAELGTQLNAANQERAQLQERAARIPELQSRLGELESLRDQLVRDSGVLRESIGRVGAELAKEQDSLRVARSNLEETERVRDRHAAEANRLSVQAAELATQLDAERNQSQAKIAQLREVREELTSEFKNLANDILEEKSKRFTEQNRSHLGLLLDPLQKKLVEFQSKVETVYDNETRDRTALGEQVRQLMALNQSLSDDAKNLTSALKGSSKAQGAWGELILERVLESAGLRKGEEYDVQESHNSEDGERRPDVTVHLPEDRHLVIDSKVSLTAYEEYASGEDDEQRARALKRHMDSVRAHMRGLSEKRYQDLYGLRSLDFVLMFVPIEPAFMLAVTNDRNLFMDGWQRNVLMVSPSTLLFVVRTVAHLWRQEAQNRNAQEIAKRGAQLYDRLCAFVADLEKVGDRIGQAKDSFDAARDKLSRNKGSVIRQAEMLKDMGVKPNKALPPKLVELSADEDVASEDGEEGVRPIEGAAGLLPLGGDEAPQA
ncbi:rmuC family protein [Lysobacter antibioticus]|uniref:RmuC family protein n=1 Tax=Lysobacter antibioticus TaxID=84531 RepID=A0A0S2DUS7_LYSAN|nr:DNA recombination protein RmuC [Lysobacter antibioticus]ALN62188.1 rmuC family protein [Lysobacter antibioticus]ALN78231.1 rmuC family protein [Lysobacter antibioticus]